MVHREPAIHAQLSLEVPGNAVVLRSHRHVNAVSAPTLGNPMRKKPGSPPVLLAVIETARLEKLNRDPG